MYAVIETGGKQYRVEVGTELEVELLDAEPGKTITLDRVLLVADGDEASIGRPLVDGAAVSAEVVRLDRGPKLISFKYRPKARSRVKKGHRQELTVLRISDIVFGGKSAAKDAAKAEQDAKTERSASRKRLRLRRPRTPSSPRSSPLRPRSRARARPRPRPRLTTMRPAETAKASTTKAAPKKTTTAAKAEPDDGDAKPAAKKPAAKPRATKKDE